MEQSFSDEVFEHPPKAVGNRVRLSIVVLPFSSLGDNPEQSCFADGIPEDITTDLSRIEGSFVIARSTAFTCKGKPINAKAAAKGLDVRYVL